jgi:hypothetical protein
MSESTTTTVPVNTTPAFEALPWWAAATPEQRTAILADHIRSGVPVEEYTQAAADYASAAELLAVLAEAPAEPKSPDAAALSPAEAQAQGAADAAQAAQADAEAQEQKARAEAQATLKQCVSCYRRGERAYRDGLLASGGHGGLYVVQRLTLGDKRRVAVQTLEGKLGEYASSPVDVNALIACHAAWHLLAEELSVDASGVPYGHYRDAWRQLVLRVEEDTPRERWILLPGSEAECRAAFATAVKDGLSRAACQDKAKAVLAAHVQRRAEATEAEAKAKRQEAEAKAAEQAAARTAVEDAARKAEAAKKAAEQAQQAEVKAQLTAAAEQALAEKRAAERAQAVAVEEAVAAQREQAQADATAKAAKEAADKAAEKARKAAEKANKPPQAAKNVPPATAAPAGETPNLPHKSQPQAAPVRKQIAAAQAKDAGDCLAEAIAGHETPDDVLQALLTALRGKYAKALSKPALRAVHAALVLLERADSPAPVQVAQVTAEAKAEAVAAA